MDDRLEAQVDDVDRKIEDSKDGIQEGNEHVIQMTTMIEEEEGQSHQERPIFLFGVEVNKLDLSEPKKPSTFGPHVGPDTKPLYPHVTFGPPLRPKTSRKLQNYKNRASIKPIPVTYTELLPYLFRSHFLEPVDPEHPIFDPVKPALLAIIILEPGAILQRIV